MVKRRCFEIMIKFLWMSSYGYDLFVDIDLS